MSAFEKSLLSLLFLAFFGAGACSESSKSEEERVSSDYCGRANECDPTIIDYDECVDTYTSVLEQAKEISQACGDSQLAYYACIATWSCDSPPENDCSAEGDAAEAGCPEDWLDE